MECIDVKTLEQKLRAFHCLDESMVSSEDDWLRMISSGENDTLRWYIMDNGSGDSLMVLFHEIGILLKGFDHENALNQFGAEQWDIGFFDAMFAGMPEVFYTLLTEEEKEETTFCMWYLYETEKWYQNTYPDNDGGKAYLLGYIPESAEALQDWAEAYYEVTFHKDMIEKIFEKGELTEEEKELLVLSRDIEN